MRVTCQNCNADIIINESQVGNRGMRSACSFCGAKFTATRNQENKLQVSFGIENNHERSCVHCGKVYKSQSLEGIPICPTCKQDQWGRTMIEPTAPMVSIPTPLSETSEKPRISQPIAKIELEKKAVREEKTHFGDEILLDNAAFERILNKKFDEEADKKQVSLSKIPSSKRSLLWYVSRPDLEDSINKYVLALPLVFLFVWFVYRTFSIQTNFNRIPGIQAYHQAIKKKFGANLENGSEQLRKAKQIINQDNFRLYPKALEFSQQAFAQNPASTESLRLIAISYAHLAMIGGDKAPKTEVVPLSLLLQDVSQLKKTGLATQARLLLANGDKQSALQISERAYRNYPEDPEILRTRALILLDTQTDNLGIEESISLSKKAARLAPQELESFWLQGQAYEKLGQPSKAAEAYEYRLQKFAEDPRALYGMGSLEYSAHDYKAAREWFKDSLRHGPDFVQARFQLAKIYHRIERRLTVSERHLNDILNRYSYFATKEQINQVRSELIQVMLKQGKITEAARIASSLPQIGPLAPDSIQSRALALMASGRYGKAINDLQTYLRNFPSDALIWLTLGKAFEKTEAKQDARNAYQEAQKLKPNWLLPYLFEIILLLKDNQNNKALGVTNLAINTSGLLSDQETWEPIENDESLTSWADIANSLRQQMRKQKKKSAALQALLGLVQFQTGISRERNFLVKSSTDYFQKASRSLSTLDYPWIFQGRSFIFLGNTGQAKRALEKAIRLGPKNPVAHYWLGSIYVHEENWDKAQEHLKISFEDSNWTYRASYQLGNIAFGKGNRERAKEWWRNSLKLQPNFAPARKKLLQHRH